MSEEVQPTPARNGVGLRIAIARSRFNDAITSGLAAGAVDYLTTTGAQFRVYETPGAFELPLLAARLIDAGYDAVVALGAVVNGETDHYEHVATQATAGLMRVMLDTGKPVAFGILTVRQAEHAVARSQPGPGNKGGEAAAAAVEMAISLRDLAS